MGRTTPSDARQRLGRPTLAMLPRIADSLSFLYMESVRDELWSAVSDCVADGAAVCLHPADNEQGYTIHTAGQRRRHITDFDGLQLVSFLPEIPTTPQPSIDVGRG